MLHQGKTLLSGTINLTWEEVQASQRHSAGLPLSILWRAATDKQSS